MNCMAEFMREGEDFSHGAVVIHEYIGMKIGRDKGAKCPSPFSFSMSGINPAFFKKYLSNVTVFLGKPVKRIKYKLFRFFKRNPLLFASYWCVSIIIIQLFNL